MASYAWGLGLKTNNESEWLALYFRIKLVEQLNISDLIILGDSKHVILQMIQGSYKKAIKTKRIHERINEITAQIQVSFYHILRKNNIEEDRMANSGVNLDMRIGKVNGITNFFYVP